MRTYSIFSVLILSCAAVTSTLAQADSLSKYSLSANGFGPVKVGMTIAEAEKALGVQLTKAFEDVDIDCSYVTPQNHSRNLLFMVQKQRISRVDLPTASSRFATDKGIQVGDSETKVYQAYGTALIIEPHAYGDNGDRYLTWWTSPRHKRGIRYETMGGRVTNIQGGDSSIELIEGCL